MSPRVAAKRARLLAAASAPAAQQSRVKPAVAITDITAQAVREPVSKREYVVTTVRTDAGISGIGEADSAPGSDVATVIAALIEQKKTLLGRDATAVEVARPLTAGVTQGAINMALLDITGKLAKAPVYEVLGGPTRFKARAAAGILRTESLSQLRAAGFRAVLVPLPEPVYRNQGQAFVRSVRRMLDQLRSAAGDDMDFILDCNGALSPGDAQMLAHELERFHLLWLDEPCSTINLAAAAKISQESATPIGFGRHISRNSQFQDLLRLDAIDVLRPNILQHGITQIRKAAALAETYYVALAPHHRGGPVATAACLHLAASIPNFFIQEVPFPVAEQDRRMRAELVATPVESVIDGYLPLPTGPGLGITLNPDALQKYRAV